MTRGWAAFTLILGSILACDGRDERNREALVNADAGVASDAGRACEWTPLDLATSPTVNEEYVRPQVTDEAIDQLVNHHHLVHEPEGPLRRTEVVLLLAGVGSGTNSATRLLGAISRAGFRAVSLAFVNEFSVDHYCERLPDIDDDCYGDVLREMIYGDTEQTGLLRIGRANAVFNRISKLLLHLRRTRGAERWGDVVDEEGVVDWRRVAVMGGPQCGRLAAYLSRDIEMARAVLVSRFGSALGAPEEADEARLAPWHTSPRATPAERTYAIWHGDSASAPGAHLVATRYGLDAFGPVTDVDGRNPPYDCAHLLRTRQTPIGVEDGMVRADESLVHDRYLPLDAEGQPLLTPAYLYALIALP